MAVRREIVELSLIDHFSTDMVKAAAAAALMNKELHSLSGESVQASKTTRQIDKDIDGLGKTSRRTEKDIDKLSGRIRILADLVAILGPTGAPLGAVATAGISGLVSQLGFAVVGAGTAVLAFQGFGDALKAMNKAELEPTAENLEAARIEMERLSPAAQDFLQQVMALKPQLKELRDIASEGLFPGLAEGLDGLEGAMPRVERIVEAISTELGDIAGDAGQSLGSERWAPFLDFLADEGPSALRDFATAAGNTAHALAGLWMSTDPLNDDFSEWLVDATADFDRWANALGETEGFADFLDYVEQTGPQVADTLGALANAALQIVQAASPLGGPVLKGLEAAADVIAAIANSDLGTPIFTGVAALALLNRGLATTEALAGSALGRMINNQRLVNGGFSTMGQRLRAVNVTAGGLGKTAGLLAGLTVASTGAADGLGLTNTTSLALMGTIGGPWGVALGAGVGAVIDLSHANDDLEASLKRVDRAIADNNLGEYKAGIEDLNKKLRDIEDTTSVGDFFNDMPGYFGDVIKNPTHFFDPNERKDDLRAQIAAKEAAQRNAEANRELADSMVRASAEQILFRSGLSLTKDGLDQVTMSSSEFADSLTDMDKALNKSDALSNMKASYDAVNESIKENGRTLDINTAAGRANMDALKQYARDGATNALLIDDSLKRTQAMDRVRENFVTLAAKILGSRKAAEKLADRLKIVNGIEVNPKINTGGITQATDALNTFIATWGRVPTNAVGPLKNGYVTQDQSGLTGLLAQADGGTIPGPRLPYGDKILMLGAPGEEVITNRNGEADRFRADRAAGRIPAYAGGGTVGGGLAAYIRNDLDMKYPDTLKQWNQALAKSTKVIDKEREKRDDLLSRRSELQGSIIDSLRTDPFGERPENWEWMAAGDRNRFLTEDPNRILKANAAAGDAYKKALQTLTGKGLDGRAYELLAGTGDLERVQAYAGLTKGQISAFESLVKKSDSSTYAAGKFGAGVAFNPQINATNAYLASSNRHQQQIVAEIKDVKTEIRRHAAKGKASKGATAASVRTRKRT